MIRGPNWGGSNRGTVLVYKEPYNLVQSSGELKVSRDTSKFRNRSKKYKGNRVFRR